jgi:hypothetical protein
MITWAAILVLQGAEGGVGEHGGDELYSRVCMFKLT